jgi:putative addiction module killer protein
MFSIRPLPEFTAWIDELKDQTVRGVIAARIKRLELGLMRDVQPVGDGVSELRIHLDAGWRLYFTQRGTQIIVLLGRWLETYPEERHQARQSSGRLARLNGGNDHE